MGWWGGGGGEGGGERGVSVRVSSTGVGFFTEGKPEKEPERFNMFIGFSGSF